MTLAAAVSAAKPWIGWSLTMRWPRVRMIRHPPAIVPAAIVSEADQFHPEGDRELRRVEEAEPAGQVREDAHRWSRSTALGR